MSPSYMRHLEDAVGDPASLLDVGCGANSPIGRFSRPLPRTFGVDLFAPAVETSRAAGIHDDYRVMDVRRIGETFAPGAFEVAVAFDLIEHLTKDDGRDLLGAMERVASRRVVVLTPNGFLPQDAYDSNELQAHRSGWSPGDFRALGYSVYGINGLRALRGEMGTPRWRPARVWGRVAEWTQPIAYRRPGAAFHLLAVKDVAAAPQPLAALSSAA
jgi:hypothetical protein